jgi:hypothetical protein
VQVFHVSPFKRNISIEHGEEHDSCTPHINCPSIIALLCDDFRCYISRCAALIIEDLTRFHSFSNSKISYFDVSLVIEEDVLQLDISMKNVFRMNIADSFYNLFEKILCEDFIQLASLADIGK